MEEGERSTQYFLKFRKEYAKKKEITQLKCDRDNRIVKENEDILKEVVSYSKLYKKEKHDRKSMNNYTCLQNINQLDIGNKEMCEGLLTQEECKQAIFAMQKNKAPGSDGFL